MGGNFLQFRHQISIAMTASSEKFQSMHCDPLFFLGSHSLCNLPLLPLTYIVSASTLRRDFISNCPRVLFGATSRDFFVVAEAVGGDLAGWQILAGGEGRNRGFWLGAWWMVSCWLISSSEGEYGDRGRGKILLGLESTKNCISLLSLSFAKTGRG